MAQRAKCARCGARFDGRGKYCLNCVAQVSTQLGTPARKPRAGAKAAVADTGDGPLCPHCKAGLTWENMHTSETEISIYVREKMYFCPGCRAVLGFSSWHTEG